MDRNNDNDGGEQGADEGRVAPRRRQLKSAALIFNDSASLMDCTLRNISETGAGIECENTQQIPDNVVLRISDGVIHRASVVWRTPTGLGLRFEENQDVARLLRDAGRLRSELSASMTALLKLAEQSLNDDFGHPRVNSHLENVSKRGRQFLASLDRSIDGQ